MDLAEIELRAFFATNKCVECGSTAHTLVDGTVIYPHRKDLAMLSFWKCSCGAYVGCHKGTTTPLGSPAGEEQAGDISC